MHRIQGQEEVGGAKAWGKEMAEEKATAMPPHESWHIQYDLL